MRGDRALGLGSSPGSATHRLWALLSLLCRGLGFLVCSMGILKMEQAGPERQGGVTTLTWHLTPQNHIRSPKHHHGRS